ncbi:glycosyltransferase family 2 protein [Maribrevibacterium harenarium]|uniref:Glycosyltransferase family 2 protein n=1 Tax=Maribrevibacterium harenarium TaxID=2589817 RepID=A0A501WYF0_9GAMM|nr:glycosyltransferase [Maribrevibacterium harenarium]TPE54289.1 glycosyltransferase family 2 protein [Maribrevibacterium harenarium]
MLFIILADILIYFIVTNFNNAHFSKKMYDSISRSNSADFTFVIVDNNSMPEDLDGLDELSSRSNVVVIKNKKNVGYFSGLNIGINYVRKYFKDAKYLVVGNNDIVVPSDFFERVASCETVLKKYPVVAPNIRMLDGTPQNPHVISGISKKREFIYDLYHSSYLMAGLIVRLAKLTHKFTDRKDEQQHEVAQEIHQGYGACYILTPKFFEYFDELWAPTFLMYEEYFLAKQLEEKGFKTYYEPRISVTHHCHASTGMLPGKLKWQYSREAHKEYRKYVKVWS